MLHTWLTYFKQQGGWIVVEYLEKHVMVYFFFICRELACSTGGSYKTVKERRSLLVRCLINTNWKPWMGALTLASPPSTPPPRAGAESTVWLGPITQWLRLLSIWKIKLGWGGLWRWGVGLAELNEAPQEKRKKHAELSKASTISITKEEVGALM